MRQELLNRLMLKLSSDNDAKLGINWQQKSASLGTSNMPDSVDLFRVAPSSSSAGDIPNVTTCFISWASKRIISSVRNTGSSRLWSPGSLEEEDECLAKKPNPKNSQKNGGLGNLAP